MTALSPWARSGRKRPAIVVNVSGTVISTSFGTGPQTPHACVWLAPSKLRRPLLEERLDPLRRILRTKGLQERSHLHVDPIREGTVEPAIDALDDQARGDRRAP